MILLRNTARLFRMLLVTGAVFFVGAVYVEAATLSLSPNTGVYTSNSTFTVRVNVNSSGASINAAEGTITFNPKELSVVSVNRNSSIFNLWVTEPTFSNSAGTINFSGGLPSGYTGSAGNIMSITFRALGSGPAKVSISSGSVLANDGRGSNVLSSMNGGSYTLQAATAAPAPEEVIVEYVAPANTPGAPNVSSPTHADQKAWHTAKEAVLNWDLPGGVIAVRTLLDSSPTAIPTKVYDSPIRTITLPDLEEGESYFHVQLKNADGWGKVTHYRLAIDSEKPTSINITQPEDFDKNNPEQILKIEVEDATSEVKRFKIQVDSGEAFEVTRESESDTIKLPVLEPGYHTAVVEAFDEAGNSIISSISFNIESFEAPTFTEFPTEINEQVIPVLKGTTRPNAKVEIVVSKNGTEPTKYELMSDGEGNFTFIPNGRFSTGVYEITARATDAYGAQSSVSEPIKLAVQQPGFIRIGSLLVSVLSVIIPLILLTGLTVVGTWYMIIYLRRFRRQISKESNEALDILHREFGALQQSLQEQAVLMSEARKTKKLSAAEAQMIEVFDKALQTSQRNVEKEIADVARLTNRSKK